ncbi:MAG TPA: phospho-sugar mutase [Phycisphaerae bacterium]|nr:phospho-sugar mutase [Phycisphaerae bacterium]
MLHPAIQSAAEAWLSDPVIAETDKAEIRQLLEQSAYEELTDRFYRDLEFGTGGMRGLLGAGRNRMNLHTVGAAAQGLANYILSAADGPDPLSVAIACDCRRMSEAFAARVAGVMAGNNIRAYLFDALRPTPELSFAVRHLGCTAGVMITASHNPPEYNGLKVYWRDGAQVVPPHDEGIIAEVRRVQSFSSVKQCSDRDALNRGLIVFKGKDIDLAFLQEIDRTCLSPQLSRKHGERLKIVYTPLHGTGYDLVPAALQRRGFQHVIREPRQSIPSGEFPTVKSPNPEEPAALAMGIALAQQENADLVLATDPDADRVGIAVRGADGSYTLLTGNRIGALLTYYICEQLRVAGRLPENAVMFSTIVSSDLAKEIARAYGVEVVETLTGFKWIAAKIREYEEAAARGQPTKTFIFGMEESYGYLPDAFVRDKDAVTSCAFIADAAAFAAERGQTLYELLETLFRKYGYFQEGTKNVTLKGKTGAAQIAAIMQRLRSDPPRQLGGTPVVSVSDIMTGMTRRLGEDGGERREFDLPASDVLIFMLADGTKVISRPSGTEPKIKFYVLARLGERDLARAETACSHLIEKIDMDLQRLIEKLPDAS